MKMPDLGAGAAAENVCSDCGCVIADPKIHARFHSILSSHAWMLAVLKTTHIAASIHDEWDTVERIDRRRFDNWSADEHDKLWNRLRFAEMVLDRVNAEVDGVPWREAARLSESLEGEPVTEPKSADVTLGVGSGSGDGSDGLFVHGSHEAVTVVRGLVNRQQRMEHEASHLIETCRWYSEDFAGPEDEWRHFVGVEVPDQVLRIVALPVAPASGPGVLS